MVAIERVKTAAVPVSGIAVAMLLSMTSIARADSTVFVIAGTKSMSGALEGRSKLELVREAMAWNLATRSATSRVGIVTFGTRGANDCADVTITAPPAAIRPADISTNLGKITPKGRAPLADAMRIGGSFLPPGAPGNLIVFTDSPDTCKGDPCAVAAELKAANAGLKIDIIALGVKPADQAKLVCAAAATGGAFTAAASPADVIAALAAAPSTAVAEPPKTDDTVSKDGVSLKVAAKTGAGDYTLVEFVGPNAPDDWVGIVRKGASANEYPSGSMAQTREGSPAKLTAPSEPGDYEVRYFQRERGVVVAKPIEVTASTATLEVPETVVGAGMVDIAFKGPAGALNYILVVPAGAADGETNGLARAQTTASPISLRAPLTAGEFEVRYVLGAGKPRIIERKTFKIAAAAEAVLSPATVKAKAMIDVDIKSGPMGRGDYIYISQPGQPDSDYAGGYTSVSTSGKTSIRAPETPGGWELRYVVNANGNYVVIGRAPLTVE